MFFSTPRYDFPASNIPVPNLALVLYPSMFPLNNLYELLLRSEFIVVFVVCFTVLALYSVQPDIDTHHSIYHSSTWLG